MLNRETALKMARDYVQMCKAQNINFNHVFVFGSAIRNMASENSDVDVLLVSDQFSENTLNNWKMLAPISAKLFDIDPHPYPTSSFIKGDPFVTEVLRTGVEIS